MVRKYHNHKLQINPWQREEEPYNNLNTEKISQYVNNKIPNDTFFTIPFITPEQVTNYINKLDCSKATCLDGIGPRILKIAACAISPSIAKLINKSIATGCFPSQLGSVHN